MAVRTGVREQDDHEDGASVALADGLIEEFNAALWTQKGVLGLDEEQLQRLSGHFRRALAQLPQDAPVSPVSVDELTASLLEAGRATSAGMDAPDSAALHRTIGEVAGTLERRESRIALEFSQRMQVEGRDSALAWLRAQVATESAQAEPATGRLSVEAGRLLSASDTVRSRSRRLRGPPRG